MSVEDVAAECSFIKDGDLYKAIAIQSDEVHYCLVTGD